MQSEIRTSPWLARYAAFCAAATLGLIALGGLVTSHGAGMAVPDWPTTYGYNMFLFPISQWVGGIFYEHTHRLYASGVGLLTVVLALWLQWRSADRRLVRLGWLAVFAVVVQGVLGGLRVSLMKDQIGILHAALAQGFLVLLVVIAIRLSAWWPAWMRGRPEVPSGLARWASVACAAIFLQLVVGAAMRHQHAGLAVPDFPLAYGRVWPRTDEAFLQTVNARRTDTRDFKPITAGQVYLHMTHRGLALGVSALVLWTGYRMRRSYGKGTVGGRLGLSWMALILVQVALGAATVWSNKAADVATAHVVVGAASLGVGVAAVLASARAAVRHEVRGMARGVAAGWSGEGGAAWGGAKV